MDFIPLVAMTALIVKGIDFLRMLRTRDINGVTTQLAAWGCGVAVTMLAARTVWADAIVVGFYPLSRLGTWSLIFAGLTIGSAASVAKDALKAVDPTRSGSLGPLIGHARHRRDSDQG